MIEKKSITVTFRDHIADHIENFSKKEGLDCEKTRALLSYLSGAIVHYREEGVEMSPAVVVTTDIRAFLDPLPGAVTYKIGELPLDASFGSKILKECAPLFGPAWSIYIERTSSEALEYGVFSYFRLPSAPSIEDSLPLTSASFGMLMRKSGTSGVEFRGAKGNILTLVFSTHRGPKNGSDPIGRFARHCVSDVSEGAAQVLADYLRRMLTNLLNGSHGTILVCRTAGRKAEIRQIRDAVVLNPAIDFGELLAVTGGNDVSSLLMLLRSEELLAGLMKSDGMVMFDTKGRVTAYRAFYKSSNAGKGDAPVVGGARRRAFEGVKALIPSRLAAALFRSQDGLMIFFDGKDNG